VTTHTAHEHELTDGCPRCDEEALDPARHLDSELLGRAVELASMRGGRFDVQPKPTDNELLAAAKCLTALEQVGRMLEANQEAVERYFRQAWRIAL
jgi:hypothetical protein